MLIVFFSYNEIIMKIFTSFLVHVASQSFTQQPLIAPTSGLSYKAHYDSKNYDASCDWTSGVADYNASIVNYNAYGVNYNAESFIVQQPRLLASFLGH